MEYVGKNESLDYPGFFHVPGLENFLINTNGRVIDTKKNMCPLSALSAQGYWYINGLSTSHFIHRLLALTFLPKPDHPVDELDVNHIDGVKTNNAIENLEWATRSENCLHAYKTGLRTDNTPILVKDLRDNSIVRYYSLQECARAFKCDGALIFHHLLPENRGKVSWNFYILIREGEEWPIVDESQIGKFRNGTAKALVATNSDKNESIIFESIGAAAEHFGYKPKTLTMHLLRYKDKPYNGWVFKYIDDPSLVDESNIVRLKKTWKRAPRKPVPIRVTNTQTNEVKEWVSGEAFATVLGVSKNTFQARVQRNDGYWNEYRVEYIR